MHRLDQHCSYSIQDNGTKSESISIFFVKISRLNSEKGDQDILRRFWCSEAGSMDCIAPGIKHCFFFYTIYFLYVFVETTDHIYSANAKAKSIRATNIARNRTSPWWSMKLVIFLIQLGRSARHCRCVDCRHVILPVLKWPLRWVVICMSLLFALFHCPSTDPSLCFDVRAERICWTLNLLTLNLKIYMFEWIKSAGLPDTPAGPVRELFILLRPVIAVSRRAWPASHAVTDSWQMRCGDHAPLTTSDQSQSTTQ